MSNLGVIAMKETCNHEWVDTTDFDSPYDEMTCIHCGWAMIVPEPEDGLTPTVSEPDMQTAVEDQLLEMVRERDREIIGLRKANRRLKGEIRGFRKSIAKLKEAAGTNGKSRYRNKNHQGRK